jgi:hypothetical protein
LEAPYRLASHCLVLSLRFGGFGCTFHGMAQHIVYMGIFCILFVFFFLELRFLERHAVFVGFFFLDGLDSGLLNAASGIDALFF